MFYKEKKLPVDDHRINPDKELDLRYWSVILKSDPNQLKRAVKKVGTSVADVKRFLHPDWKSCSRFTEDG